MKQNSLYILLCILALGLISPVNLKQWKYQDGELLFTRYLQPAEPIIFPNKLDLNHDESQELVVLRNHHVTIYQGDQAIWKSPTEWQVTQTQLTDLNRDGDLEVTLLVWRPFKPWPIDRFLPSGGRINEFHDQQGLSCHLILIGRKRSAYRELWAGSALAKPVRTFVAADLDKDGKQELVTLEGNYSDAPNMPASKLVVWEWNGFGFDRRASIKGIFDDLKILLPPSGIPQLLVQ